MGGYLGEEDMGSFLCLTSSRYCRRKKPLTGLCHHRPSFDYGDDRGWCPWGIFMGKFFLWLTCMQDVPRRGVLRRMEIWLDIEITACDVGARLKLEGWGLCDWTLEVSLEGVQPHGITDHSSQLVYSSPTLELVVGARSPSANWLLKQLAIWLELHRLLGPRLILNTCGNLLGQSS